MTKLDIKSIIEGCSRRELRYQELFYKHFYGYAMTICLTYSNNREDAVEIMNDGFLKVFNNIHLHDHNKSLEGWIRRIMINTAIDHYRKNLKHQQLTNIDSLTHLAENEYVYDKISTEEILKIIQSLPPAYKMVFNLYVLEGFSHKEISAKLNIAESTSRSNLVMANRKLRTWLEHRNKKENV